MVLKNNFSILKQHLGVTVIAVSAFCFLSLLLGFYVPRIVGLSESQAIAIGFEVGIHNAALAIYVAVNTIGRQEYAIPATIYSILMYLGAFSFYYLLRQRNPFVR